MAKKPTIHITQNENGWGVKVSGRPAPVATHTTQSQAIETGKSYAKSYQTELRIHGRDGKIRETMSYGNDPFPPRDRD